MAVSSSLRLAVAAALLLGGCATNINKGGKAFRSGNYEKAYDHWLAGAAAGDAAAQHNMGLLW